MVIIGFNQVVGAFIDLTGLLALLFSLAFLVVYGIEFGIKSVAGLFVSVLIIGFAYSGISTWIMRGESAFIWAVGTFGVYPIAVWLSAKVA